MPRTKPNAGRLDRKGLSQALRGPERQRVRLELRQSVSHMLTTVTGAQTTPAQLNEMLLEASRQVSVKPLHKPVRPHQEAGTVSDCRRMWRLFNEATEFGLMLRERRDRMQCLALQGLGFWGHVVRNCFGALRSFAQFRKASKAFRYNGRNRRKAFVAAVLQKAANASTRGDAKTLYSTISSLVPKSKRKRVKLKSQAGELHSQGQEYDTNRAIFHDLFTAGLGPAGPFSLSADFIFEPDEITQSLRSKKAGKATPHTSAPPDVWRECADLLTPFISSMLPKYFSKGIIQFPPEFTDCTLCLLPKPNKAPTHPSALRPLGLQCPLGKSVARMIKSRLMEVALPELLKSPQFAYLPHRSTSDAIGRACAHSAVVRENLKTLQGGVRARRASRQRPQAIGGCQIGIDLSQAFDRVSRPFLAKALRHVHVNEDLIQIVMGLHQTSYLLTHHGSHDLVDLRRGLRQGCTVAPALWAIVAHYLLFLVAQATDASWVAEACTMFADDLHVSHQIKQMADLQLMCNRTQAVHEVFRGAGMVVNAHKSQAHIALKGRPAERWLHKHCRQVEGHKVLELGSEAGSLDIPLTDRLAYLGTMLSYRDFEMQTFSHRSEVARVTKVRRAKFLFSRAGLSVQGRLGVLKSCFVSTLVYGLEATGVVPSVLPKLAAQEAKIVRVIARAPVHLELESTHALYTRLGYTSCVEVLEQRLVSRLKLLQDRATGDAVIASQCKRLQEALGHIAAYRSTPRTSALVPASGEGIPCPDCGLYFGSRSAMRAHRARKHGQSTALQSHPGLTVAELSRQGTGGMPTCRHCGHAFFGWNGLRAHIV